MMTRASVIVVAHNSRPYLAACLASISGDIGPADEIIVVDNASSDGSAELVAERFPDVRLIRADNTGYAGGNNRGAAAARGAFLVFLNPDTTVEPGAIAALLAPLAQPGDIALATARITLMDRPEIVNACGNTMHYTGLTYCRGAGRPAHEFVASCEVDAVSGAAFAIRRPVFEALGGFDERFFMYVEDSDLSLRARLAGHRIWFAADARVRHAYRPSYAPRKAFYLERNRHLMLLKNLSRATYLRLLPGLLLAELATWGFLALCGYWSVKPNVYAALWRERGALRTARERSLPARGPDAAIIAALTHRLDFGQLAGRALASLAAALLHPAFRLAQRLVGGGAA